MVFGFNNFNMMNMFPMNFGSFGFGSFGCGTGYSNFGSSLFGCGFGNNYLNPTNCDGSTNWGAVGFGLTAAFAPMLLNWGVGAVEKAIQNSNGNQQEVVAGDIDVLQGRVDEALKELGSGVTESNYTKYDVKTESWYTTEKETINKNILEDHHLALNKTLIEEYDGLIVAWNKETDTSKKTELKTEIDGLQEAYNKAKEAVEAHEKAQTDLIALEKKATEQQEIKDKKIKEIADLIEQRDKAKAELEELRLDDYDGTAIQRTSLSEFKKIFDIDDSNLTKNEIALLGIDAIEKFSRELGIPSTLRELGATKDMLPLIAQSTTLGGGYKILTHKDILSILEECY